MGIHCAPIAKHVPFEIKIVENSDLVEEVDVVTQCGQLIDLTLYIDPLINNEVQQTIVLQADIPEGYSIVGGDGETVFDANGNLTLEGMPAWGVVVNLQMQMDEALPGDTESMVVITTQDPYPSLCNTPNIKLTAGHFCIGDSNLDGQVTSTDLTNFLNAWGNPSDACGTFDFNFDGEVTATDLTGFLAVFGKSCDDILGLKMAPSQQQALANLKANVDDEMFKKVQTILQDEFSLSLSPNPVSELLQIHIDGALDKNVQLSIFDTQGKIIYQQKGNVDQFVQTKSWPAGLYLCRIQAGANVSSQKFIKQ